MIQKYAVGNEHIKKIFLRIDPAVRGQWLLKMPRSAGQRQISADLQSTSPAMPRVGEGGGYN